MLERALNWYRERLAQLKFRIPWSFHWSDVLEFRRPLPTNLPHRPQGLLRRLFFSLPLRLHHQQSNNDQSEGGPSQDGNRFTEQAAHQYSLHYAAMQGRVAETALYFAVRRSPLQNRTTFSSLHPDRHMHPALRCPHGSVCIPFIRCSFFVLSFQSSFFLSMR